MDAEELTDGDSRLLRSDSLLGRSRSSRILLNSAISSDAARLAKYERLPHSMSSPDNPPHRWPRVGLWRILADAVAFRMHRQATRRHADDDVAKQAGPITLWTPEQRNNGVSGSTRKKKNKKKKEKKKRRWSSWLPDPHRRWPVQGF